MKLAAVVPALFVLISLCGSPVPAPPGSVSGIVYFDANHNGVHDSCDSPLSSAVLVVTASDKSQRTTLSGSDGAFHVDGVPTGDSLITLSTDQLFWPVTTFTTDGRPGVTVSVKELKDTSGIEVGSISRVALPAGQAAVTGVVFDDANGNGLMDAGECGISGATAWDGANGKGFLQSTPGDGTFTLAGLTGPDRIYPRLPAGAWKQTTGPAGSDACADGVVPQPWHSSQVYEALIGYQRSDSTGSISGVVFNDTNENGVRDADEDGLPYVSLGLQLAKSCADNPALTVSTGDSGAYRLDNVAPGQYQPFLLLAETRYSQGFISPGWPGSLQITIGNAPTTTDLPLRMKPAGYVAVTMFYDLNQDGLQNDNEPGAQGYSACLYEEDSQSQPMTGPNSAQTCGSSFDMGNSTTLGPVAAGTYRVVVTDQQGKQVSGTDVYVAGPDGAFVSLPIIETDQLPFDAYAQPVKLDVCYSDPGWVQRPFEDGYDPAQPFYASWGVDEAQARAYYSLGIYAGPPADDPAVYIWSSIAGLSWRSPPGCDASQPSGPTPLFDLVGLEPVSAVQGDITTQITVRRTDQGLYSVTIPPSPLGSGPTPAKVVRFVDESGAVIASCDFFGACRLTTG